MKAIILDRDGVINRKLIGTGAAKYVLEPGSLEIYEDFYGFAKWANEKNIRLHVATNQQAIGLGILTDAKLDEIHHKIQTSLISRGVPELSDFFICKHLKDTCGCRKPKPGLLLEIIDKYNYKVEDLLFIGDTESDLDAAESAGVRFIEVCRGGVPFSKDYVATLDEIGRFGDLL